MNAIFRFFDGEKARHVRQVRQNGVGQHCERAIGKSVAGDDKAVPVMDPEVGELVVLPLAGLNALEVRQRALDVLIPFLEMHRVFDRKAQHRPRESARVRRDAELTTWGRLGYSERGERRLIENTLASEERAKPGGGSMTLNVRRDKSQRGRFRRSIENGGR